MMRFPRFFQPRRRPRGATEGFGRTQPMLPAAQLDYDPVRARFESECG